jgi:hypothetical protein
VCKGHSGRAAGYCAFQKPFQPMARAREREVGFESMRGELQVVKWMLGFNLALTVTIVGNLFLGH